MATLPGALRCNSNPIADAVPGNWREPTLNADIAFFYGLKKYHTKWSDLRHGFHFDLSRKLGPQNPLSTNGFLVVSEVFCAANHGTVSGFKRSDSGIVPILGQGWFDSVTGWGFNLYRETVMSLVAALDITEANADRISVLRPAIDEAIQLFWSSPSLEEARAWGSYPWDAGQGSEDAVISLADPISVVGLTKALFLGADAAKKHHISWLEGSVRLSSAPIRLAYLGVKFSHRLARKLNPLRRSRIRNVARWVKKQIPSGSF